MAHSCRWRFPARPGGSSSSGTGRRAGRTRVTASLRTDAGPHPNHTGLGPGFDAALQVSAAIGSNLRKFRDVLGEWSGSSSGEEEAFGGFGTDSETQRIHSPGRTHSVPPTPEKKPRGRPPRALVIQRQAGELPFPLSAGSNRSRIEGCTTPGEKAKRPPGRPPGSGERRRGRPPASSLHRNWQSGGHVSDNGVARLHSKEIIDDDRKTGKDVEAKFSKLSKMTKLKRLREVKLSPLKSRFKAITRKGVPVPGVPRRRRGRPPSAERLKADAAAAAAALAGASTLADSSFVDSGTMKQKAFRVCGRDQDLGLHSKLRASHHSNARSSPSDPHSSLLSPQPASPSSKLGRPLGLRQSPRNSKPVRIVPTSKRTDATIAKQLLQRAKKGAQKKKLLEKESGGSQSQTGSETGIRRRRRTQLKNIRQFIMPVVSTVSLRIIKTPKRFIEDEAGFGTPPTHMKIPRLEATPTATAAVAAVTSPATQPSSSAPPLFTAASSSPSTAAAATVVSTAGSGAAADSLPPPPTPAPTAPSIPAPVVLASAPTGGSCNNSTSNGRLSSSAASCGSSAVSQHSSQLSSGESSRSSTPSLDDSSCDSQASEGTQALSEEPDRSPSSQCEREDPDLLRAPPPPSPLSEPEHMTLLERGHHGRRCLGVRRGPGVVGRGRAGLISHRKKAIISPATGVLMSTSSQTASQQISSTASSSSSPPPPPLLSQPQAPQSSSSSGGEHHAHSPWLMSHSIPPPFIPGPSVLSSHHDKRRSILREPTFRWTSFSSSEQHYFSSAKYAKEGLIRKPIFDNFRPPPLTAEDVGLMPSGPGPGGVPQAGFPAAGAGAGGAGASTRLFSPVHHQQHSSSSRFELSHQKRSPLLRAPRFTPSEAHSRIFESVTLPSSSGSSPGSLSPLQGSSPSSRTLRRRRRRVFGPLRGQPRSPSHSMTRRSSHSGVPADKAPAELSPSASASVNSSVAGSSISTSALTQASFSTFSSGTMSLAPDGRKASSGASVGGNPPASSATTSSQLFPLFASSPQTPSGSCGKAGRDISHSALHEPAHKEKDREREKENKREGRKEWERRGKDASNLDPSLFGKDGKEQETEEALMLFAQKKTPGRKKSTSVDSGTEVSPADTNLGQPAAATSSKGRPSKKGRSSDMDGESEVTDKEKHGTPVLSRQTNKHPPASTLGTVLAHVEKQPVTDRRVVGLLKKAKAQLYKIEKSRSMKAMDQPKVQGPESDSSETSVRGPRIKHVCRRAAVALGRHRAVFPDDMPTLSALPWEEREKILSSMGNDDKSSVAGSEEAEPPTPPLKPVTRHKAIQEAQPKKGRRSRRCGQCPGCQVPEDCGVCTNCLDKPKFGGRNIKKQCCKDRKCQNLQWMPSKMFLQKQGKGKKDKRRNKCEKKDSSEGSPKQPHSSVKDDPPRRRNETPLPEQMEEKQQSPSSSQHSSPQSSPSLAESPLPSSPTAAEEVKQPAKPQQTTPTKKDQKSQQHSTPPSPVTPPSPQAPQPPLDPSHELLQSQTPPTKVCLAQSPSTDGKKKPLLQNQTAASSPDPGLEAKHSKKQAVRCVSSPKPKEKAGQEHPTATPPDSRALNLPSTPSARAPSTQQQKGPRDGVHRLRVDFREDHALERVWEMGGLSVLSSVPVTPRVLCFLCASSGNVEFVFCQVCCEPFHLFCLGETERPLEEHLESWCCRRCRFCHACGRQHQNTKQLLECDKCRNSYHPECLGPNHPTRPTKKKRVWICTKCVCCKSCGATKPGNTWDAQWSHDFSLCHDCAKLLAKGNFCPLCDKCYDDEECDSKIMQCGRCDRWVHAKCEGLTDEMYEILSKLPENTIYTCISCTERPPAEWRTVLERKMQSSIRQVLTALLNSHTSTHLLRYRQAVMKPPELNPETEESLPSRRSPEGPDPPVLTEVTPSSDSPADLESIEKKMDLGRYRSVLEFSDDIVKIIQTAINSDGGQLESKKANSMLKTFFIRQMERVFPWFKVKESRFWERRKASSSGLLPNAVLPPSLDHNYAQWQEREDADESLLMKKLIPTSQPKTPGASTLPTAHSPPHPIQDLRDEDSPEVVPPPGTTDNRQCELCLKYGDEKTNEGGRLLYIGQNEWTHVNCALWSAEVFEDDDGSLKNVHMAVIRGRQLRCENCQKPGATVACCLTSCTTTYHFMCARQRDCVFLEDKKVYCQRHRDLIKGEVLSDSGFEVTRRVLVDFEGISLRRTFSNGLEPHNVHLMIGSMTIDCLGMLTELSDCERKLFPIGYQCSRVYWSTLDARKRCVYTCRILVCHAPVVEPEANSTVPLEENFTITHSPTTASGMQLTSKLLPNWSKGKPTLARSKPKMSFWNKHPRYMPCQPSPMSRPLSSHGFSSSTHEIVTVGDPLLSPSFNSIGSRRHNTSSVFCHISHQKLASSSTFSKQTIQSYVTPFQAGSSLSSFSRDRGLKDFDKGRLNAGVKSQNRETASFSGRPQRKPQIVLCEKTGAGDEATGKLLANTKSSSTQTRAAISQASPPLATAVLTGNQRSNATKAEKTKHVGKNTDLPTGSTLLSSYPQATLPNDRNNLVNEGSPSSKDVVKSTSPQPPYHKSGGRKLHDFQPGPAPAAAMKPLWASGAATGEEDIKRGSQATPAVAASLGSSSTKEKFSRMGVTGGREVSKEKEKNFHNSKMPVHNSKGSDIFALNQELSSTALSSNTKASVTSEVDKHEGQGGERPLKSRFSTEKTSSPSLEGMQSQSGTERSLRVPQVHSKAMKDASQREKKHAIKVSLLSQKVDPNGIKAVSTCSDTVTSTSIGLGPQKRLSCPLIFSSPSASSESSESESHHIPEDCEEPIITRQCGDGEGPDDADDAVLDDDDGGIDKHHEDDSDGSASAKRRYPRRSARARSNMFFGLTPFYGVRSYGEEDIPFYSGVDPMGKKRSGGSKRSAEGQVDGADDISTSSSEDSAEDEVGLGQCSNRNSCYYNFTRTIVNPNTGLPALEGMGRMSQFHGFLSEDDCENLSSVEETGSTTFSLGRPRIGQLDGVDDGSESDASLNTTTTTTATTSTIHKSSGKRKGRESRADKMAASSAKDAENKAVGGNEGSGNRDSRKNQKDNSLPLGAVKSQGQDPLEAQLSLTTDLLKSDSDNNNSDDCGNILPSDIMEFVLNTPSMQTLVQQPEASSSELLLDEGYGVDVNQRKDILFDDFSQPLPSSEPVESGVNPAISVEEPYGLPLELPSDLSVLTTRSPSVSSQNHSSIIPETSERAMLSLTADEIVEKSGDKTRPGTNLTTETQQDSAGGGDSKATEGQMTPEHFIASQCIEVSSPSIGPVVESGNQDLTRASGTPVLPSSPNLPRQGQKYIPPAAVSPGPSQVTGAAVQTSSSHLKPGPEKVIVVNQHLQPLYVLQTLPNGVTQKIQIAPSASATGVMSSSPSVLNSMTLTTGLNTGISTSQPIFPAAGKGLVPMAHHPHLHAFTSTTQASFQPVIPSTTSSLFIGLPSHDPVVVSEAGPRHELAPTVTMVSSASSMSPSPAVLSSGNSKKRPISRLQPRKMKKLARSRSQPMLAPSEVGTNMTLINLSSTAGIPTHSGLVELGTITTATTTSHRKIPNIIKRPKSDVMYFEPTILQPAMPITTSAQPGILGHDSQTQLLPCTVSGLNPNQSVLNVVSVPPSGAGNILGAGQVSLSTPGLLSPAEITGPLLFKASPHNLGLSDQQMVLHSGGPIMSQLAKPVQTSIASSICVLPPHQTISMSVSQQVDPEGTLHLQHPVGHIMTDKTLDANANSAAPLALAPSLMTQVPNQCVVGVFTQSSRTTPISRPSNPLQQFKATAIPSTAVGKGKQKTKRLRPSPEQTSGKKSKGLQANSPAETLKNAKTQFISGCRQSASPEPMDTAKAAHKQPNKSEVTPVTKGSAVTLKPSTTKSPGQSEVKGSGALRSTTPDQERSRNGCFVDHKPKKGLIFEISSDDGFQIRCESIEEAWKSLTDKVQEARSNARLKELSFDGVNGLRMLGVLHDAVVFLLEQLYGARYCQNYRFRFHKPDEPDEPPVNPHGSARAELHHRRSVFDIFNFLASKHRQPPEYSPQEVDEEDLQLKSARRSASLDLPMVARFRHLKKISKEAVGVYRSPIHGRGLFCKRNIEAGEMIIEYSGNVIRSVLSDKREKYYDSKGVGCYMFRISEYEVVDATMHGNAARFINHSCEPNCYSRVIAVDGQKHIVIFAMRKIYRGEELTYDYKFPIEETGNKLPCNCGAKTCRRFLN
ncbi:histone-lysine N-methyltransferase 2A isoform X2 [Denticeps clupeoides]|uniref:histone-lysine N-methyltransferase 2A isoform X2 n=1 Tax=Denticeps clupeoides TaxID=299321 RepID=UPI0010A464BA|nr:histone-lysine N-methyltransferase 2A isoform X2 [Denticeps clupeoides]